MPTTLEGLFIAIVFFVPGFICTAFMGVIRPRQTTEGTRFLIQTLTYGSINLAIWGWAFFLLAESTLLNDSPLLFWFLLSVLLVISPITSAIGVNFIGSHSTRWIRKKLSMTISSMPSAWDNYFYLQKREVYLKILLKSGKVIRGKLDSKAFIGANPEIGRDIYLNKTFYVNKKKWIEHRGSGGVYVPWDEISFIQFIK
ncbi:MAG: hypothetical protein FVQ79_01690 [Planctomycetes bacterium]|nr:hypothetical protein [Planctomycetota bacterium]